MPQAHNARDPDKPISNFPSGNPPEKRNRKPRITSCCWQCYFTKFVFVFLLLPSTYKFPPYQPPPQHNHGARIIEKGRSHRPRQEVSATHKRQMHHHYRRKPVTVTVPFVHTRTIKKIKLTCPTHQARQDHKTWCPLRRAQESRPDQAEETDQGTHRYASQSPSPRFRPHPVPMRREQPKNKKRNHH